MEIPILDLFHPSVLYSQVISGPDLSYRAIDGFWGRNVSQRDVIANRLFIDFQVECRVPENRFQFRSKDEFFAIHVIIKRLLTNAVASQDHRASALVPQCECKHATKLLDERFWIRFVKMHD